MRVRLSDIGMAEFARVSAYEEFVVGRPIFEVEAYDGCCYLHRPTGCTFMEDEVESVPDAPITTA